MSGHSKWSTIKRQKGVADIRRGQQFTKMANAITVAAREGGGNPEANFKLRLAIEAARAINTPKENIERAIARGTGAAGAGAAIDEVVYEGYGPGGIAIMVVTATDNRQRTSSLIRSLLERSGGSLGGPGAVAWIFNPTAEIEMELGDADADQAVLQAADAGAEDAEVFDGTIIIYAKPEQLDVVKQSLESSGFVISRAELTRKPTTLMRIQDPKIVQQVLTLMEKLEELDDVQKVYSNFDIPDELVSV
ncbi:MAG: YebC/PmpR family DNA-binding transcriptional regulator [Patescibacteria group bacterium]|nr:YebC/PmpR family DNA-binding transcriptional regulator [Patescibacteria group bacterium]